MSTPPPAQRGCPGCHSPEGHCICLPLAAGAAEFLRARVRMSAREGGGVHYIALPGVERPAHAAAVVRHVLPDAVCEPAPRSCDLAVTGRTSQGYWWRLLVVPDEPG